MEDDIEILIKRSQKEYNRILKLTLYDYVDLNILTENQAEILKEEFLNKKFILITGPTASGKSHFSKKLLKFIKSSEYCEIKGQDDYDLVESKIRKRNHTRKNWRGRLLLDELNYRNYNVFSKLYTRHDGSLTIIHGNTAEEALKKLEAYDEMYNPYLYEKYPNYSTVYKKYISIKINYIVVMKRISEKMVKVESVKKLCGFENGKYILQNIK